MAYRAVKTENAQLSILGYAVWPPAIKYQIVSEKLRLFRVLATTYTSRFLSNRQTDD